MYNIEYKICSNVLLKKISYVKQCLHIYLINFIVT